MKTSNIILLVVFASILIWILAAFMTAKSKMKEIIEQHPEIIKENTDDLKRITTLLEAFNTIVVSGKGNLYIEQSDKNSFDQIIDENNELKVKNDTLFIKVAGHKCYLNVTTLNSVHTKDKVWVEISDIETDSLSISTNDNSGVEINDLSSSLLLIKAFDKSKIKLYDVNKKGMKAEFFLKNFSHLKIDNTEGMSLSVNKESDASYEDQ